MSEENNKKVPLRKDYQESITHERPGPSSTSPSSRPNTNPSEQNQGNSSSNHQPNGENRGNKSSQNNK